MTQPRYLVVLTNVRTHDRRRDERSRPEHVICHLAFEDLLAAMRTARIWVTEPAVAAGRERVKVVTDSDRP